MPKKRKWRKEECCERTGCGKEIKTSIAPALSYRKRKTFRRNDLACKGGACSEEKKRAFFVSSFSAYANQIYWMENLGNPGDTFSDNQLPAYLFVSLQREPAVCGKADILPVGSGFYDCLTIYLSFCPLSNAGN